MIFVALSAPGDELEIELTKVKKNFAEARWTRILVPGPARVSPPCPVANECGGCSWQQVEYSEQLRQKRALVIESLRKFSAFEIDETRVASTVPSPREFRYRNRIQLHHSGVQLGFFKRSTHEISDIDDCLITDERLALEIPRLKRRLAHEGAGRIEIYLSKTGEIGERRSIDPSETDEAPASDSTGPAFSQVNSAQNENLIAHVLGLMTEIAASREKRLTIHDLYAGGGNFSFPLATALNWASIHAVELNAESVADARHELAERDLTNLEIHLSDVGAYLSEKAPSENDVVILDPPRTGCAPEVMTALAGFHPRDLIYVSCHPVTLARDLRHLARSEYEIRSVFPFDMFPQTDHVETVVHLHRKDLD